MESGQLNTSPGVTILNSRLDRPASTVFKYEQLDPSVDSIRLLVLLPGTEDDDVACELIHKTFASKPKYEALSYTWGDPGNVKSIRLHDFPFEVRETLYCALFHLRSKTEKRLIWADAICIDQKNVEERSNQVRLMSFIYGRAQAVVVWLGIPMPSYYDESRANFREEFVDTLCNHPYWRRVWIIQEISLPRNLKIGFSNATFNWDELRIPFRRIKDTKQRRLYDAIERVLDQREKRHDDKNRLELLLERFSDAQCGEVRDKVFGFVGLAHDCYDGSLKVDYSASLYDVFADVVKFQNAAKPLEGPFYHEWEKNLDTDRPARLVRFAQLVQRTFDGGVDITAMNRPTQEDSWHLFHAKGYIAGTILHIGSSYDQYISSFAAEKQWKLSWDKHYTDVADLATLREMDDAYTMKLLEMGETDLAKVRQIHSGSSFGFQLKHTLAKNEEETKNQDETEPASETHSSGEPRRFLGSLLAFGLVPPAAREGDLICRFWGCNIAVIVRQEGHKDRYNIVGRADVAETVMNGAKTTVIEYAIAQNKDYGPNRYDHMDFYLNIETLQKMTS